MKLKDLYRLVIREGMSMDPRGISKASRKLKDAKSEYDKLPRSTRRYFDGNRIFNPYSDTRILNGNEEADIKHIFVGIDIDGGELLLIDALRNKGVRIDLALSHHPSGKAVAALYNVMDMQADILAGEGVSKREITPLVEERMREVQRRWAPANHERAVDIARILDIPFMCAHTVADNFVATYLQKLFDKKRPGTLGDLRGMLLGIPEFDMAMKQNAGPNITSGSARRKAGRVFVDMTGGTEGPKDVFDKLSAAGVGTLVAMHMSEEHLKKLKESRINLVVAGHIASDNLGLNLLLDRIQRKGGFKISAFSGFRRVERDGKDT